MRSSSRPRCGREQIDTERYVDPVVTAGDLGVSVSAVIAEIQSKYSKTVGKSYSVSQNWSYTAEVKAGQVRRLQQLKQSWMVQVVRWRYTTSNCKKTKEISTKTATFPVKNHDYMWILIGQNS